jgi:glycosyltransferase involved in cell wall biosynthesis
MMSDAEHRGIIRMLGCVPRADLPALYRMADAFLCVSWHEGFGFPALEAMACGTPVVSSMTGAMDQTLRNAAMAADADDVKSIAGALEAVLADSALRDRLGEEGISRAASFRWSSAVAPLLDMYRSAADRWRMNAGH